MTIANYDKDGRLLVSGLLTQQETLSHVRVTKDDAQAISNGTATQIQFDDVVYDTLGEFDSATYTFTPINSGYYSVALDIMIGPSTAWSAWTETANVSIYVNGIITALFDRNPRNYSSTNEYVDMEGVTTLWLNAGDALTVYVYQVSGSSINTYGDSRYNFLAIDRLPEKVLATGELAGAMELIDTYTATGTVASVTLSGIPGTYKHLQLMGFFRGDAASTAVYTYIRWNGVSSASYFYVGVYGSGSGGPAEQAASSVTYGRIAYGPGGNAPVNSWGGFTGWFRNYSNSTTFKEFNSMSQVLYAVDGVPDMYVFSYASILYNISPITSITLYPSSGNYTTGTTFDLYGIK